MRSFLRTAGVNILRQGFRWLDNFSSFHEIHPPARIFLIRTHAIGDILLTTPVLRALKQALPSVHLSMLVGESSRPVLENNPRLDDLLSFPESWWFKHRWSEIWRLTHCCRQFPKDALILFHAAPFLHLWGRLMKAPLRVGFDNNNSSMCLTHPVPLDIRGNRYLGDINLDLVRSLGVPAENAELEIFLTAAELSTGAKLLSKKDERHWLIGVAPGGGQNPLEKISVKQWPAAHYVQLLQRLLDNYPVTVALLGDRHDNQVDCIAESLKSRKGRVINLKGRTKVRELAGVINHLDLLITNDSSPMHLAVALKTPVVALFGPTSAKALFPAGPLRLAVQSRASCSPCYPFGRFPGCPSPRCMQELAVDRVYRAVTELLDKLKISIYPKKTGACLTKAKKIS
jgi:lipopolysaccharide heptosyltransferase II